MSRATSHGAVRDLVARLDRATVPVVCAELGVSDATAWRYLNELVDRGELDRGWVTAERAWVYALPGQAPASEALVVDCSHKKARHQHGTPQAYKLDGCRCTRCRTAHRTDMERWTRAKAYGRATSRLVDAAPVREHLVKLSAAGMGRRTIARKADVAGSVISRVMYGRQGSAPSRRCNQAFAAAILALEIPAAVDLADHAVVDGTGTRRRLQALARLGWSVARLATETDVDHQRLRGALAGKDVLAATARAVAEAYDRLWDRPAPAGDHRERISVARTINRATAAGWPAPLAWDDDTIDDPAATPSAGDDEDLVDELALEHVLDGHRLALTGATLHAAVHALAARGDQPAAIAERLGIQVRQVERLRRRDEPPRPKRQREAA